MLFSTWKLVVSELAAPPYATEGVLLDLTDVLLTTPVRGGSSLDDYPALDLRLGKSCQPEPLMEQQPKDLQNNHHPGGDVAQTQPGSSPLLVLGREFDEVGRCRLTLG